MSETKRTIVLWLSRMVDEKRELGEVAERIEAALRATAQFGNRHRTNPWVHVETCIAVGLTKLERDK